MCREMWVAGKLASAELNMCVPDIYSCVSLITGAFAEHTMCWLIALGEEKHLTCIDITPNFLQVNQRHWENTFFAFLKLSFTIFMAFLYTAICRMDSGYKALTICSCSSANLGKGFNAALERCPLCGLCAWVDVGIKD